MPTPRHCDLQLLVPAELHLYKALAAVEDLGAHPDLTDIVIQIDEVRIKLAAYINRFGKASPLINKLFPLSLLLR